MSEVGHCQRSGHCLESDIFKLHNPLCFQLSFWRESSPSHLTNPPPVKPLTAPTNTRLPPGLPFQPQHPAPPGGAWLLHLQAFPLSLPDTSGCCDRDSEAAFLSPGTLQGHCQPIGSCCAHWEKGPLRSGR